MGLPMPLLADVPLMRKAAARKGGLYGSIEYQAGVTPSLVIPSQTAKATSCRDRPYAIHLYRAQANLNSRLN